jgi:hypothetical protein
MPLRAENVQVKGEMSKTKRERIRKALLDHQRFQLGMPAVLTQATYRTLAALEHVEAVLPLGNQHGVAILENQARETEVAAARPDNPDGSRRLVAGRFINDPTEHAAVVTEFLLYRWGLTDDTALSSILGKKLLLELGSAQTGRDVNKHVDEFTIVGVLRLPTAEEKQESWEPSRLDADVVLPLETGVELFSASAAKASQASSGPYSLLTGRRMSRTFTDASWPWV